MRGYGWLYGPFIQASGVDIEWTLTLRRDVHFLQAVMSGDGHFTSDPPSFSRTTSDETFIDKARIKIRQLGGGPSEFMLSGAHFYNNQPGTGATNPADMRLLVVASSEIAHSTILALGLMDPARAAEAGIKDLTVEFAAGGSGPPDPNPGFEVPIVRKIKIPAAYSTWNLLAIMTHLRLEGSTLVPI